MPVAVELAGLAAVAIASIVAVWVVLRMARRSPEKRERLRRLQVNRIGRLADALITEATDQVLYYTYSVHGVEYSASQDITALRALLPPELGRVVGVANLKYDPRHPANSILVCEEWSGLRLQHAPPARFTSLRS
jgi:hypothetical protein